MADGQLQVTPAIIVQGGGFAVEGDCNIYKEATEYAANVGHNVLKNGGTAVDAVEQAIRVFEEHSYFNAGRGSCLNTSGEVECDALIMDGDKIKTGAVISARHFRHPVTMARKVMEETRHCALTGEGALEFALSLENFSHEICAPKDLKGDDCPYQKIQLQIPNQQFQECTEYIFHERAMSDQQRLDNASAVGGGQPAEKQNRKSGYDTASAVAIDNMGRLACANSTGGMPGKLKGRVSDASLVGCGAYANQSGAATTNGPGESIMKMTLAREAVYNMEQGQHAQEAADNAVQKMRHINSCGGVIAISKDGDFGKAFNTHQAVWASMKNNKLESGMVMEP